MFWTCWSYYITSLLKWDWNERPTAEEVLTPWRAKGKWEGETGAPCFYTFLTWNLSKLVHQTSHPWYWECFEMIPIFLVYICLDSLIRLHISNCDQEKFPRYVLNLLKLLHYFSLKVRLEWDAYCRGGVDPLTYKRQMSGRDWSLLLLYLLTWNLSKLVHQTSHHW